ncbi:MAG: 50S ribosomal protein L25/general stress protein Ctc [Deltaproteobacteria bacterium]|nr:50S ribosomal protein L25/general stress protein Ctc [Deltaproteobacteria bacterium]
MERIELKAKAREGTGKGASRQYRRQGLIPGVVYGAGTAPISLTIDSKEMGAAIKGATGENAIVTLSVEREDSVVTKVTMIQDIQIHPIRRDILHVDFHEIDLKNEVDVSVPVRLIGKAEGSKMGGIVQQIERELHIRCMPLQIPDRMEVDVTPLAIGESIHVRDLPVGEGVTILTPGEHTIVTVVSPVEEAAAEAPEGAGEEAVAAGEEEGSTE